MSTGKLSNINTAHTAHRLHIFCYRFVDRDMTMRYLVGLGVGHTYAHTNTIHPGSIPEGTPDQDDIDNGSKVGEGNGAIHCLEVEGEDAGDEPETDDHEDDDNDDQEYGDGEGNEEEDEEDFDKGSDNDYSDDGSVPSETGGSQDSEDEY